MKDVVGFIVHIPGLCIEVRPLGSTLDIALEEAKRIAQPHVVAAIYHLRDVSGLRMLDLMEDANRRALESPPAAPQRKCPACGIEHAGDWTLCDRCRCNAGARRGRV